MREIEKKELVAEKMSFHSQTTVCIETWWEKASKQQNRQDEEDQKKQIEKRAATPQMTNPRNKEQLANSQIKSIQL